MSATTQLEGTGDIARHETQPTAVEHLLEVLTELGLGEYCGLRAILNASDRADADIHPARLRQKKHMNVALLVIDEVGFEPMTRQEASLFFRLVSYRYGRGSMLITTNKGVAEWPAVLAGDEVLATAILDRLLHRCHVLNISGRSYRLRDLERAAAATGGRG